jgi:ribose transport system substrate-binding protein
MKKLILLSILALVMALALGVIVQAQDEDAPMFTEEEIENSTYLQSHLKRKGEVYDTSEFAKEGPYRIALASQGPTNSWAALFDAHVRWRVEELGPDVVSELLYADASGSADVQVPQVEDLLAQDPDALILVPMGRAALSAPVERAMAQGVPVVLCASGVDTDNFVTEVGTNLYQSGKGWAEWLVEQLDGEGNIVQMNGIPGVDTAETEIVGAEAVWAANPGITILDAQYGNWSTAEAKQIMEQWIAQYGEDIDGVWSGGAQMSMGIISAFNDAGLPIPPIGGGEYMNGFLRVAAENDVAFYAVQYPPSQSVLCVDTAIQILQGEEVSRYIDFRDHMEETRDFTDEDIEEFYNADWSDDVFGPVYLPDEKMEELGYLSVE